eukprot:g784.t1
MGPFLESNPWINDMFALGLYVYHARRAPSRLSRFFVPYLDWILKEDISSGNIMRWSKMDRLLRMTEDSLSLGNEIRRRRQFDSDVLRRVQRSDMFSDLTLEQLQHLSFLIQSRTFGVRVKDRTGKWHSAKCLVPLADVMNTAPSNRINTECFTNSRSTHFECRTTRDVEPDGELFAPYAGGHLDPGKFLLNYGFTLPLDIDATTTIVLRSSDDGRTLTFRSVDDVDAFLRGHSGKSLQISLSLAYDKVLTYAQDLVSSSAMRRCLVMSENFRCVFSAVEADTEHPEACSDDARAAIGRRQIDMLRVAEIECRSIRVLLAHVNGDTGSVEERTCVAPEMSR